MRSLNIATLVPEAHLQLHLKCIAAALPYKLLIWFQQTLESDEGLTPGWSRRDVVPYQGGGEAAVEAGPALLAHDLPPAVPNAPVGAHGAHR